MYGDRDFGIFLGFFLLVLGILGVVSLWWQVIGDTLAEKATRLGIVLEMIGILSAIPDILGERTTIKIEKDVRALASNASEWRIQIDALVAQLRPSDTLLEGLLDFFFDWSGLRGLAILLGNALSSLACAMVLIGLQGPGFSSEKLLIIIMYFIMTT